MRRAVKIRKLTHFMLSDYETDKAYSTVPVRSVHRAPKHIIKSD